MLQTKTKANFQKNMLTEQKTHFMTHKARNEHSGPEMKNTKITQKRLANTCILCFLKFSLVAAL